MIWAFIKKELKFCQNVNLALGRKYFCLSDQAILKHCSLNMVFISPISDLYYIIYQRYT